VNLAIAMPELDGGVAPVDSDLRLLFHRLNNQLGIILAHAELLEGKALDDVSRARAEQVVASALDAMGTVRELCDRTDAAGI
jgi:hypothetical protein